MPDTPSTNTAPVLRDRTPAERMAYLDGFEAGVQAMVREVTRLNFSEIAQRAEQHAGPVPTAILKVEAQRA